jgi:hypothetical protein
MWIVLLDHSGSMGEPFQGRSTFEGLSRTTQQETKLEAAKEALLRHVAGLGGGARLVVVEFTRTASVVFDGAASDSRLRAALDPLQAGGETDIAAALSCAAEVVRGARGERVYRALAITDGISAIAPARDAAQTLASQGVTIDAILIDVTDEGDALARAISIDGSVTAVTSRPELEAQVGARSEAAAVAAREADEVVASVATDAAAVLQRTPQDDRVAFTVAHPSIVLPETWYSMLVYAHLARLADEVAKRIVARASELGQRPGTSQQPARASIPRDTTLLFRPVVPGVEFNPAEQAIRWTEGLHEAAFRLRATRVESTRVGTVEVYAGGVVVGCIPLALEVAAGAPADVAAHTASASMFRRVFASYSRADADVVDACAATYEALGIYVFVDRRSLRSGDRWRPVVQELIEKSDVFQLYWSRAASDSKEVEREWRSALDLLGSKGDGFVRPLYWDELPPVPRELEPFHFAKLDLPSIARRLGRSAPAPRKPDVPARLQAEVPLPATVVAGYGAAPSLRESVREDVSDAIRLLEATTGLRYYPAPTALVDEVLIRRVREERTPAGPSQQDDVDRALALVDVLQMLSLELHTQFGSSPRTREYQRECDPEGRLSPEAFRELIGLAEWFIAAPLSWPSERPWQKAANTGLGGALARPRSLAVAVHSGIEAVRERLGRCALKRLEVRLPGDAVTHIAADLASAGLVISKAPIDGCYAGGATAQFDTALARTLVALDGLLPALEGADIDSAVGPPVGDLERADALMTLAAQTAYGLPGDGYLLGNFLSGVRLERVTGTGWRSARDRLAALGVRGMSSGSCRLEFLQALAGQFAVLMRGVAGARDEAPYTCSYGISATAWSILERIIPSALRAPVRHHAAEPLPSGEAAVVLEATIPALVDVFEWAATRLPEVIEALRGRGDGDRRLVAVARATFGVFVSGEGAADAVPRRVAADLGPRPDLDLAGQPRVLLCLGAQERFRADLEHGGHPPEASQRLAALLRRAVLVHEHCHAILETGRDEAGGAPSGPRFRDEWGRATPLNEALAAWMELHAARDNPEMKGLVDDYAGIGPYPAWPYAGAVVLEDAYRRDGLEAIRSWVGALRRDPAGAQARFDAVCQVEGGAPKT